MAIFPNMIGNIWRGRIAIPAAADAGTTFLALLRTAGYPGPDSCALKVLGIDAAGASRAAMSVATPRTSASAITATDFTTHGQPVLAGVDYYEPSDGDAAQSYVRALAGATFNAQCVVCW